MTRGEFKGAAAHPPLASPRFRAGFTLLEVMIAVGILAIALLALLGLHHQDLRSIIRGQDLSQAAMLAQGLMTDAELERSPALGASSGDFHKIYPGQYRNFRWRRVVTESPMYPGVRQVEVTILYGPGMSSTFTLVEFLYYPQVQNGPPARRGRSMPLGLRSSPPGQR